VFLVVGLCLAILWRKPWLFVALLVVDLVADGISLALRDWIGRRRPPLVYPDPKPLVAVPHSGAFPSGHTTTAFACATVLAWASPRLVVPAFVLAAAIGFSRIYVGVHWPLDVLGGAVLGVLAGLGAIALLRRAGAQPRLRPARQAD
jgi:undecaprenyl-diphosphatase